MDIQKITKTGLKELHDIACHTWKNKLITIANREPFSDSVEISDSEIKEMFEAADETQLKVVKKYFTKPKSIIDKVKSYEDACEVLDVNSEIKRTNYEKLCIVIEALNEGWKPDFNNTKQYKYYNWFRVGFGSFVFYDTHYFNSDGIMVVPSALYLKDKKTAIYCKDNFFELYKSVYM